MDPQTRIGTTTLARLEKASIKKIMRDLAATQPELFVNAMIDGLQAPAPRSFPYLALAAAYLDGKPVDAEPAIQPIADLSALSNEELRDRAERIVRLLKGGARQPVIDVEVIEMREPTLDQLQQQVRDAEADVERANEEARRAANAAAAANAEVARLRGKK